jgi:RNA polymerase sigma-70 factor (ECF subfamily)
VRICAGHSRAALAALIVLLDRGRSRFETVVRAYSADLYRFAYWQCRDRFVAEDALQETFARAWKAWHALQNDDAVKSWLFAILRHELARLHERRRFDIDPTQEVDAIAAAAPRALEALEMREALDRLAQDQREALLLQVLGGFSCAEIGAMLSISEVAATTRLSRARAALRRLIEPRPRAKERSR